MVLPKDILKVMDLAGEKNDIPFTRLERGKPLAKGRQAVEGLLEKDLGALKNPKNLSLVQSALYIYFDCFEEAHQIAQDHEGLPGNWLHAVLHRREPDAGNSKYWYHRVSAPSEVLAGIGKEALEVMGKNPPAEVSPLFHEISESGKWRSEAFVDACEKVRKKDSTSPAYKVLAEIQGAEWRGLLGFILSKS